MLTPSGFAFVVRCVCGNQMPAAVGTVAALAILNISSADVGQVGTLLIHKDYALAVGINGAGQRVYLAGNGLCIKIGIQENQSKRLRV